jgi:ArsR family transcriptional regulator
MQSIKTVPFTKGPALSAPVAERLAELFGALGDPTRLRIISALLAGERNVGDIALAVGMTQSAVSHQLRGLRQIRIVRATKLGREVYYALDDDHVADLFTRGLDHVKHG